MITAAQIKKGSTCLLQSAQDMLLQIVELPENKQIKPVKFTFYQCINTLVDILHDYARSSYQVSLNIFIVDWHVKKYEKDSEIYRHFIGLTYSLKKYLDTHQDAKLFLSLFNNQRNNKERIRWFLKLRKTILKTINTKILAQISVTHSDAITITHMLYEEPQKSKLVRKINQLFINLKRKLINTAKIDGAVACEFFLKAEEQITIDYKSVLKQNNRNNQIPKKFSIHKNHNVSFSDENLKFNINQEISQDQYDYDQWGDKQIEDQHQNSVGLDLESIEQEWAERQHLFNMKNSKYMESLKILSDKDRDIDAKLKDSGFHKRKKYPEGWQEFIQTNKLMKEKLLHRKNY